MVAKVTGVNKRKLESARKKLGYTYTLVADRAGLKKNKVWSVINRKVNLKADVLHKILHVLELDIEDVLENEEKIKLYKKEIKYLESRDGCDGTDHR